MHKATVNDKSFEISSNGADLVINGEPLHWDVVQIKEGYFHILYNHKSYRAEVVKAERATKTFTWKINSRVYTVQLKDKFDLLLEKLGMPFRKVNKKS